jgi:hypothetical protein
MTRTRSVAAGVAVAFAVALGGWWAGARSPARPRPALATVYQLELEHDQRGRIELGGGDPGAPLRSRLVVRGALALGPATPVDGAWVRSMTLTSIEQWSAAFGEADVSAATQAAATGATARMVLDDRGAMIGLDVDPATPPVVQNVLRLIASELQHERGQDDEWSAREWAHAGRAEVRYRRVAGQPGAWLKTRTGYLTSRLTADPTIAASTSGGTRFQLDPDGDLVQLAAEERIVAGPPNAPLATVDLSMTLRRGDARVAVPHRSWRRLVVDQPTVEPEVEAQVLRMRIGDLTAERMMARVDGFATAEGDPDFPTFLWQATALLVAEPGLCDALVARVRDGTLTAAQRGLVVDLLVHAGHGVAQAHLRALWGERARFGEPGEVAWLAARLGNLAAPEPETIAALVSTFDDPGAPRAAVRFAAGALVAVARGPAQTVADEVVARLRDDHATAASPAARIEALRALHNAGRPDTLDLIVRSAGAEDPFERAAAAEALTKLPAAAAAPVLVPLVRDPSPAVQRAALETLVRKPVDAATVDAVAAAVLDGSLSPRGYRAALNVIRIAPPGRQAELVAYMAPRTDDAGLRRRLLGLLPRD